MINLFEKKKFLGLFTRQPVTKNRPDTAVVAYNVKISGEGVEPCKGYTFFGKTKDKTASLKITDAFTFTLQDGSEIPLRVLNNSTNNIIQWYDATNDDWYDLLSITVDKSVSFQDYNTSSANAIYFGNGTDNHTKWSGKITRLTAAVSATDTTINVVSTSGFATSGTIIYNGTEIAYSAKTATTFTVASAHASAGADDGVAEAADDSTFAGVAVSKILLSAHNRMYLVNEADPNSIEYSKEGDAENWTAGANRADAGVEDFPVIGGRINGLASVRKYIVIFKARTILLFNWLYPTSTTKAPDYEHIVIGRDIGSINHKGIANIYNELFYTTKNGVRSLSENIATGKWDAEPLTGPIYQTIKDYDFSDNAAVYDDVEDVYLVACKSNSDLTHNNRVIAIWFYYDTAGERRRGFSILDWPVACWFHYDGKLYFGSSVDGNTYRAFNSRTKDGQAITSIYTNNRDDFGKKNIKQTDALLIQGLIAPGTEIEYTIFFDGGNSGSQAFTIKEDGLYVSKKKINTLGAYKLGEVVLGSEITGLENLKQFTITVPLQMTNFYDIQIQRKAKKSQGNYLIYYEGFIDTAEVYDSPHEAA